MIVEIPYMPRQHQRQIHEQLKRFNVLVCHRRFGKTVTAINQALKSCLLCQKDRPRFAYIILIPLSIIEPAYSRPTSTSDQPKIIGMDVGMSLGGDASAFVVRQGGQVQHAEEFRDDDTIRIAGRFKDALEKHNCDRGYIDSVGYGAGVAQTLQAWGRPVKPVNVGERAEDPEKYVNKKAELWWVAKDFFTEGTCSMPDGKQFRKLGTELSTPSYDYSPSGKVKIQGKKDLVKAGVSSPNLADAFCLTFASSGFFGGVM